MDLSTALRAMPIGLVIFVGMYLGMRRRRAGWGKAAREFPELATELGLTLRPPRSPREIGQLRGALSGHEVIVDPDERCRVAVRYRTELPVLIRSYDSGRRPPPGFEPLELDDAVAASFPERFAAPELADALTDESDELSRRLSPLARRRVPFIKDVTVSSEGAECIFDFGRPPHIPPDVIRQHLPVLLALVEFLERVHTAGAARGGESSTA